MHALRDGYNDFKWTIEQTGAHLNWFNQCYRLIESVNRSIDTLRTFVNFFCCFDSPWSEAPYLYNLDKTI